MDSITKLVGNNFKFVRSYLGKSAAKIAQQLNVKRTTFHYFESGQNKFLNEPLAKKYHELLTKMPGFPSDLTYEEFLIEDISEGFTGYDAELAADTHSSLREKLKDTRLIGYNFSLCRKHLGESLQDMAEDLGLSAQTLESFENGEVKFLHYRRCKRYFRNLRDEPSFPSNLTLEDFLTRDLAELFTIDKDLKSVSEQRSIQGLSDDFALNPKSGEYLNEVSSGLKDFLNDKMEMAIASPTKKEIEILVKLRPVWKASKEFYRIALGDLRRNRG